MVQLLKPVIVLDNFIPQIRNLSVIMTEVGQNAQVLSQCHSLKFVCTNAEVGLFSYVIRDIARCYRIESQILRRGFDSQLELIAFGT